MNAAEGLLDPQQQLMFAHLTRFAVGVGLAWFTIAAMRLSASTVDAWSIVQGAVRTGAQVVVLRVLLPATAVLTLVKQQTGAQSFAFLFGIGFALTVALFIAFFVIYLVSSKNAAWNAGTAASMGGGNRGLATLLVLSGILFVGADAASERDNTIAAFLAVDLGNFLALLVALPFLMALFSRRQLESNEVSISEIVSSNFHRARWDIFPIFAAIVLFILVNASGPSSYLGAAVNAVGEETASVRGVLVLYLAWLYVFATLPSLASVNNALGHAMLLAVLRICLAIGTAYLGGFVMRVTPLEFVKTPEGLAIVVLLISPVSSFAAVIVKQAGADEAAEQRVSELVVASTLVFLFVSLVLTIGSVIVGNTP